MPKRPRAPIGAEELKDVILRAIVEKFDGRALSWEIAEQALSLAALEIKQMALMQR